MARIPCTRRHDTWITHSMHEHLGSNMEGRPAKLARLQALRDRLPYISQSALAAVLRIAQQEPLPSGTRNDIRDARGSMSTTNTPYGKLCQVLKLKSSDGTEIEVEIQHPFAMMYHACKTSKSFSSLIQRTLYSNAPTLASPWHIIMYTDEITPGNQLGNRNQRKIWAIYWSVLEFGPAVLSDEDTVYTESRKYTSQRLNMSIRIQHMNM